MPRDEYGGGGDVPPDDEEKKKTSGSDVGGGDRGAAPTVPHVATSLVAAGGAVLPAAPADDDDDDQLQRDFRRWSVLVSAALERRHLKCSEQTPETARALRDAGSLGNFVVREGGGGNGRSSSNSDIRAGTSFRLSPEVEELLFESFVEDDYDGKLHLTTLDEYGNGGGVGGGDGRPVGAAFWRELTENEMRNWINWDRLRQRLIGERERHHLEDDDDDDGGDSDDEKEDAGIISTGASRPQQRHRRGSAADRGLRSCRGESARWLELVASTSSSSSSSSASRGGGTVAVAADAALAASSSTTVLRNLQASLVHSWVKIELLAVRPDRWGEGIGTLLLACAMDGAHCRCGGDRVVLHVAGGSDNLPALRLYAKFGFLNVPRGTAFNEPDRDLFVLGNVGRSLRRLHWPAILSKKPAEDEKGERQRPQREDKQRTVTR